VFTRGNHASHDAASARPPGSAVGIPIELPAAVVTDTVVRTFNAWYYRRPRRRFSRIHFDSFLYPLDRVRNWNRIYGRRGFFQYQCVVGSSDGREAVAELLSRIAAAGGGSFLAVLKVFGSIPSPGLLSFPRPGITLALDFPNRGSGTMRCSTDWMKSSGRAAEPSIRPRTHGCRRTASATISQGGDPSASISILLLLRVLAASRFMSNPRRLLICGATSAIASAAARCAAASHDLLFLVGRDPEKLRVVADDLRVRGATQVETFVMDMNDFARHQMVLDECARRLGGIDAVLIAHGTLPDQAACQASFDAARAELETNFMSVVSLLTHAGNYCELQGKGTIAVISSVAGDRGRRATTFTARRRAPCRYFCRVCATGCIDAASA
jgi:hypothetical protein